MRRDTSEFLMHLQVDPAQKISRILRQLERSRRKFMDDRLKDWGLQGDMYLFLMIVSRSPSSCQEDVAKEMMMDKGNAAKMAKSLEKAGYLSRMQSKEDKRRYELSLTEDGRKAINATLDALLAWQEAVIGSIPRWEEEKLVQQMGGMLARAQDLLEESH